jgi:hypothetical protein
MTSAEQIETYLKEHKAQRFLGCFASDKLPENPPVNSSLIANIDPSTKPGSHWIALLHLNSATQAAYFFDSYGLDEKHIDRYVNDYTNFYRYLSKYSLGAFKRNTEDYQNMGTDVCGEYSSFAVLNGSPLDNPKAYQRFKPIQRINGNFKLYDVKQLVNNDRIVRNLIRMRP